MRTQAARRGAAIALFCLGLAYAARAEVIARVDGVEITEEDAAIAMQDLGPTLPQQMSPDQRREYVVNYLIDLKLTSKKAVADRLDQGAEFERKLNYFRDKARMQALLDHLKTAAVSEAEIKRVYDDAAKAQGSDPEVKARHILVETEDQAKAALKRVRGGEDFAKVATEISKDPGSPGGDLGWFAKDQMVPEFADMAFRTETGRISEPVKSRFGWHIIKVEDKRTKSFPPLAEVRDQVERFVVRKAHESAIEDLRNAAKVERVEQQPLIPPLPPMPPPPGRR